MWTHPEFDQRPIQGEVIVGVGGGSKSLGNAVAFQNHTLLILTSRTDTRLELERVGEQIAANSPAVHVQIVVPDLSVQAWVRQAANQIEIGRREHFSKYRNFN